MPVAVADRRILTFGSNGELLDEEGPLHIAGSYAATATELTTIDAGLVTTEPYLIAADGERLLLGAMVRTGGAGATGAWDTRRTVDGKMRAIQLELRGDMTARLTDSLDGAPPGSTEGTWTRTGDDLAVSLSDPGLPLYRTFVEDQLGVPFERL